MADWARLLSECGALNSAAVRIPPSPRMDKKDIDCRISLTIYSLESTYFLVDVVSITLVFLQETMNIFNL